MHVCVCVYPLFACVYKRKKNPLNFNLKRVDKRLSRSDADADVDVDDDDDRLMSRCGRRPASTASGRYLDGRGRQGCQLVVKGRPSPPPPAGSPFLLFGCFQFISPDIAGDSRVRD